MFIESITVSNFRCFGSSPETISLDIGLTAFIGSNGSGKTALMQALLRLFGISAEQRRIRKRDFHIPPAETERPTERTLYVEALLAFPELTEESETVSTAVPEFFHQMTIDQLGIMKCRIRLEASWRDDDTVEGAIEQEYFVVTSLSLAFDESQKHRLPQVERGRIQVIYLPAVRDAASHVTNVLKGRLWKAISWSDSLKTVHSEIGSQLQNSFEEESVIQHIVAKVNERWSEVHSAGTDAEVFFSPVEGDFEAFIKKTSVGFRPDEDGGKRDLDELSDGQRSLFHIALTSALLDVENEALANNQAGFHTEKLNVPALTVLAIEEPENNLAPFYLSRIVRQIESIVRSYRAQAVLSTHSASTLTRVSPESIRYFRCDTDSRLVSVRCLTLPGNTTEAGKYVREAVRAFPELYFAKFVILGEGDSELIVLPKLAEALGFQVDPSFVSIVPLGGRHVNHFWRLLNDLEIPHATLLDLDLGRQGGGWGRIKYACQQLHENSRIDSQNYVSSQTLPDTGGSATDSTFQGWITFLRSHNVYFSSTLDIDWMMLSSFWEFYTDLEGSARGPSTSNPVDEAKKAVLKENGDIAMYDATFDNHFRWYRYLFLGRGKPITHITALSKLDNLIIQPRIPEPIRTFLISVNARIAPENQCALDI